MFRFYNVPISKKNQCRYLDCPNQAVWYVCKGLHPGCVLVVHRFELLFIRIHPEEGVL